MKTNKSDQNGNILFLILIAVALFAALSYAVTQSSRGGGNTDTETQNIAISQLLQQASVYKTEFLRRSIRGDDLTIGTGTGELFEPGLGAPLLNTPDAVAFPMDPRSWKFDEAIGTVDGNDIGTSESDIIIIARITESACESINTQLHNTTAVTNVQYQDNTASNSTSAYISKSNLSLSAPFTMALETIELPTISPPGCYNFGDGWVFVDVALQR